MSGIPKPLPDPLFFFDGTEMTASGSYFAVMEKDASGAASIGTDYMRLQGGAWKYVGETDWSAVAVSRLNDSHGGMLACGSDGQLAYIRDNGIRESSLQDYWDKEFTCRQIRSKNDTLLIVGYGGVVFAATDGEDWQVEEFKSAREASWIEAVDIDEEGRRYLGGLNGELWYDGDAGLVRASLPTNADINGICCTKDGHVYLCGSGGTLLVGSCDDWTVVDPTIEFNEDFWRVVCLGDRIWVSSMNHLFEWIKDDLVLNDFGGAMGIEHYFNLHAADDHILVVDEKSVVEFDGQVTRRIV